MPNRIDKINSLIKEQLSDIIFSRIDRDHFKLFTITRVVTSRDLSTAKVYISLSQQPFSSFSHWLKGHLYHIQGELNHRLSLHRIPRIVFLEDTTAAYVDRIEQLLKSISK